jgi:hypothetical protein
MNSWPDNVNLDRDVACCNQSKAKVWPQDFLDRLVVPWSATFPLNPWA